jgi:hypothetical protein
MAVDDTTKLAEQLGNLTLTHKPLKPALKARKGRLRGSSQPSPEAVTSSADTTLEIPPASAIALAEIATSSAGTSPEITSYSEALAPLQEEKHVGWIDIHADLRARGTWRWCDLYDDINVKRDEGTEEEREWKRLGQVKKRKIKMRWRRVEFLKD